MNKLPKRRARLPGRHLRLQMHSRTAWKQRRRAAKHGGDAAEELIDDTTKRLQRHPIETVAAMFAIGIAVGILIGWMAKPR